MKETRFSPQIEAQPEPIKPGRGGFDKLRRQVTPSEMAEEKKKLEEDPESWREQE